MDLIQTLVVAGWSWCHSVQGSHHGCPPARFRTALVPTAAGGGRRGGGRGTERRRGVGPEGLLGPRLPADPARHHPAGPPEGWPGGARRWSAVYPLPGKCHYVSFNHTTPLHWSFMAQDTDVSWSWDTLQLLWNGFVMWGVQLFQVTLYIS